MITFVIYELADGSEWRPQMLKEMRGSYRGRENNS